MLQPTAEDLLGHAQALVACMGSLPPGEWERVCQLWLTDPCPLSPLVETPQQASAFLSAICGMHRHDPSEAEGLAKTLLEILGELVAVPHGQPELGAALAVALVARSRWRGAGRVRNPRCPNDELVLSVPLDSSTGQRVLGELCAGLEGSAYDEG